MDELAAAVGADPVEFRLRHLDDERLAAVLAAAADEIGWAGDRPATDQARPGQQAGPEHRPAPGSRSGMEKDGRVATAARVRVGDDGTLRLLGWSPRWTAARSCTRTGWLNQVEGAVVMGLGPALFEQIDFAAGRILNGSMTDYRVPRLADVPADLKVVLVDRPDQPSAGGGEAPIIAVAPAIANAIFAACGDPAAVDAASPDRPRAGYPGLTAASLPPAPGPPSGRTSPADASTRPPSPRPCPCTPADRTRR